MKIGFVGYSEKAFDELKAEEILYRIFNEILDIRGEDDQIEIITGATNLGIHKPIYRMAQLCRYKTVGIMCNKGYDFEVFPVDELIVVGDNWGDESETFLNSIDILFRIGGGSQSHKEIKMAKERGIQVIEFEL